jgi:hypothetical protein
MYQSQLDILYNRWILFIITELFTITLTDIYMERTRIIYYGFVDFKVEII